MRRTGIGLAVALGLALAGSAAARPKVGDPAGDFTASMLDGRKVSLADYRGEVLVINFWATWCGPCRNELPLLATYYRLQHPHGLDVIAVVTDDPVPVRRLAPLAQAIDLPMARNYRGALPYPHQIPTSYVIDRQGVIRYAKVGAFDLDELNDMLVPLLREPAPPAAPPPALMHPASAAQLLHHAGDEVLGVAE